MDAGNLLKPMLARGELHCIGATTLNEYRQYIEKDAALERRFQPVLIPEPTVEDSITILRGLKERYEVYRMAKEIGFMSKNEMRRAENMNDIEGLDVIDFGLGSVLYDVNTHTYYTPNTDATSQGGGYSKEDIKNIEEESFIDDLNGTERAREEAENENNN